MPHLSYASSDDDEFLHPTEGWLLVDRTIAFDSWIVWRHALPRDRQGRAMLHKEPARLIQALAEGLDAVHQKVPGYSSLGESPFVFLRWWEPRDNDDWAEGARCCFYLQGTSNQAMLDAAPLAGIDFLDLQAISSSLLEARLTSTDPGDLARSSPPASRRRGPASRLGRPSLPGRNAYCAPGAQKNARC